MPNSDSPHEDSTALAAKADRRLFSPSTARNKEPILNVLRGIMQPGWSVLEIACGTGEHGAFLASRLEELIWLPTDVNDTQFESVESWRRAYPDANVHSPITIDASSPSWSLPEEFVPNAVVCINMIHITPWDVTKGLLAGTSTKLSKDGLLFLYGPFMIDQMHTAPSNAAFDESLKGRNELWGIRDLGDVVEEARAHGLHLESRVPMPANNFSLIFRASDRAMS